MDEPPINPNGVDLSHFEVFRVLGKGGFGKVQAVSHRLSGRLMAMKRIHKAPVVEKQQYRYVWLERDLMAQFKSDFVVKLKYAFQTKSELFLVMPLLQGGDLRYFLTQHGYLSENDCRYYASSMIVALQYMHSIGFLYRDVKPHNFLLDSKGYLYLSDFGLAKQLKKEKKYRHSGEAGTPGYTAPEMKSDDGYTFSADVWSVGVLLYELLHGFRPFTTKLPLEEQKLEFSDSLGVDCVDLLSKMLVVDPKKRLGGEKPMGALWEDIKAHPWFTRHIEWHKVQRREYKPPFVPLEGIAHCSPEFEVEEQLLEDESDLLYEPTAEQQELFEDWEYNVDLVEQDKEAIYSFNAKHYKRIPDEYQRPMQQLSTQSNTPIPASAHRRGFSISQHTKHARLNDVEVQLELE